MNSNIETILYASDLGEGSRPAFRHAVNLAQKFNAKITYLHVIEPIPESSRVLIEGYMGEQQYELTQKENLKQITEDATQRVKGFFGEEFVDDVNKLNIDIVIKIAKPWRCVLDTADDIDADLIILGARKHSAVEKLFLGSTSNKVAQHSTRPLLIVPLTDDDNR